MHSSLVCMCVCSRISESGWTCRGVGKCRVDGSMISQHDKQHWPACMDGGASGLSPGAQSHCWILLCMWEFAVALSLSYESAILFSIKGGSGGGLLMQLFIWTEKHLAMFVWKLHNSGRAAWADPNLLQNIMIQQSCGDTTQTTRIVNGLLVFYSCQ